MHKEKYHSHGVPFQIIGLLEEDSDYRVYLARSKKHARDLILHIPKRGDYLHYDVEKIETYAPVVQKKVGQNSSSLPWEGTGHKEPRSVEE